MTSCLLFFIFKSVHFFQLFCTGSSTMVIVILASIALILFTISSTRGGGYAGGVVDIHCLGFMIALTEDSLQYRLACQHYFFIFGKFSQSDEELLKLLCRSFNNYHIAPNCTRPKRFQSTTHMTRTVIARTVTFTYVFCPLFIFLFIIFWLHTLYTLLSLFSHHILHLIMSVFKKFKAQSLLRCEARPTYSAILNYLVEINTCSITGIDD